MLYYYVKNQYFHIYFHKSCTFNQTKVGANTEAQHQDSKGVCSPCWGQTVSLNLPVWWHERHNDACCCPWTTREYWANDSSVDNWLFIIYYLWSRSENFWLNSTSRRSRNSAIAARSWVSCFVVLLLFVCLGCRLCRPKTLSLVRAKVCHTAHIQCMYVPVIPCT